MVPATRADAAMTGAARHLAQRLAADLSSKQPWHFEFRDLDDSPVADFSEARQAFEADLSSRGFHLAASAPAENSARVTLSKDPEERLWIAEFVQNGKAEVEIVPFALATPDAASQSAPISIQRQFVFEQPEPLFDFVWAGSPSDSNAPLLVLGPTGVSLLRYNKPQWQLQATVSLSQQRALPRDAQGQLTLTASGFEAHVADVYCTGTIPGIATMQCSAAAQNIWHFRPASGTPRGSSTPPQLSRRSCATRRPTCPGWCPPRTAASAGQWRAPCWNGHR